MKIDINTLTEAELIDLNNRIVERLRLIQQMHTHLEMMEFRIGDRVEFRPEGRPLILGMVTRYNKRTVTIFTDQGQRWNVSPRLLRRATEEHPDASAPNVLRLPRG